LAQKSHSFCWTPDYRLSSSGSYTGRVRSPKRRLYKAPRTAMRLAAINSETSAQVEIPCTNGRREIRQGTAARYACGALEMEKSSTTGTSDVSSRPRAIKCWYIQLNGSAQGSRQAGHWHQSAYQISTLPTWRRFHGCYQSSVSPHHLTHHCGNSRQAPAS